MSGLTPRLQEHMGGPKNGDLQVRCKSEAKTPGSHLRCLQPLRPGEMPGGQVSVGLGLRTRSETTQ